MQRLAVSAVRALYRELTLYPKPGLVSLIDSGSHQDMNAETFIRSLFSLRHYFYEMALAGQQSVDFTILKRLGIEAERRMLIATKGINTHRGAIFMLGLLVSAAAVCTRVEDIPFYIQAHWGQDLAKHAGNKQSHGAIVLAQYQVGGAREEALSGFPHIFKIGLPTLKEAHTLGAERAYLQCFFALMAEVNDTNILYRQGLPGLAFIKDSAQGFLQHGGARQADYWIQAQRIHHAFVARNLSPGGVADLLAACIFLADWEQSQWD